MTALPLDQLVATAFSGALAFGLYLATLLACLRWLLLDEQGWMFRRRINWTMLIITFLIFACNMVYISVILQETMQGAWILVTGAPSPPQRVIGWRPIVLCTAANGCVLLADIVLIYRCWIIYGKRVVIILFPCFIWLAALVCTLLQIYLQFAHMNGGNIGPYGWASVHMSFGPGIVLMPFWISTVLLNVYASAALVIRIYKAAEGCKQYTSVKHLRLAIRIIAESGLLNLSITLAHFLAWFGDEEFPVAIIGVLNAPVVGIAFNWILIRFEQTKAQNANYESSSPRLSTLKFSRSGALSGIQESQR